MRVVVAIGALLALAGCRHRPPEIHLIPAGYTGVVHIYFEKDGLPQAHEGSADVYPIDAHGELRVNSHVPVGYGMRDETRFYFVDPDGTRHRIPFRMQPCDAPDEIQILDVASSSTDISYVVARPSCRRDAKGRLLP